MEAPGAIHHVVAKGHAGDAIVRDDTDRGTFLERLEKAVRRYHWSCLAYCLLDTHFHLIVETPEPNLGLGMKWLQSAYAQDFNYRHGRQGHLFAGRFYSALFRRDAHLLSAIVYVFVNPVRAGVVDLAEQWPWSSYAATVALCGPTELVSVTSVLELVDSRPDVARRLLRAVVDEAGRRDPRVSQSRGQTRGV